MQKLLHPLLVLRRLPDAPHQLQILVQRICCVLSSYLSNSKDAGHLDCVLSYGEMQTERSQASDIHASSQSVHVRKSGTGSCLGLCTGWICSSHKSQLGRLTFSCDSFLLMYWMRETTKMRNVML